MFVLRRRDLLNTFNHRQKKLRNSPKKTCFVNAWVFQCLILTFRTPQQLSPPFQCCNQVKAFTERIATWKTERGGLAINKKRCFLKLWKDADRKRLFCSNVSALLSMIVGVLIDSNLSWKPHNEYVSKN